MEIKKGIGVSPGVVIGTAVVLDAEDLVVPKRQVEAEQVPVEVARLDAALAGSGAGVTQIRQEFEAKHGNQTVGIFDAHVGLLKDKTVLKQIRSEIETNRSTAEYAVSTV